MSNTVEQVVLLGEDGAHIGVADKATVHTHDTPLHLAFSCHLTNQRGEVLVTRRALTKITWPGVWTNSFCGHPAPDESAEDAIVRRALVELGTTIDSTSVALPDFRYRAVDASGIVENEICPVYTARITGDLTPNPEEVCEWEWVAPDALRSAVVATPFAFSPWLVWQLEEWGEHYDTVGR
jgi:isopentenyl-diphosphate delta-isomerase